MPLISGTRLRIRSPFYLPQFLWGNELSARQLARSPGFLGGGLLVDRGRAFWTVTAWEDEAAMRAYRNSGAHREVMPKLLKWCDEATVIHWGQEGAELPDWPELHRRMTTEGKVSKVSHPSPRHAARQFPEPRAGRLSRSIRPRSKMD
jgi:hypothetical protein